AERGIAAGVADRASAAVRRAFAAAVARIWWGGAGIVFVAALVVLFGLPELKLRTSNAPEAFRALEEHGAP
ncbi:MAG TPA: hypothetical protein VFK69_04380, partial [Candidatus Eisenbacteria bacterium]|nr:hypothetical protein [Candidatus Eisenbacteria bacterium]